VPCCPGISNASRIWLSTCRSSLPSGGSSGSPRSERLIGPYAVLWYSSSAPPTPPGCSSSDSYARSLSRVTASIVAGTGSLGAAIVDGSEKLGSATGSGSLGGGSSVSVVSLTLGSLDAPASS
jgi:hypothetical protein